MKKIKTPWGYVTPFGVAEGFEGSILVILLGKEIKPHFHRKTFEYEVILAGRGLANGKKVIKGDFRSWRLNQIHGYINNGKKELKIFCITQPPYNPSDDILVENKT